MSMNGQPRDEPDVDGREDGEDAAVPPVGVPHPAEEEAAKLGDFA